MKRHKIWLALLLSLAIGCGNVQNTDGEQQAEKMTQTETQQQEEMQQQTESQKQTEVQKQEENPKQNEIEELVYTDEYLKQITDIAVAEDGRLYTIGLQKMYSYNTDMGGKEVLMVTQSIQWIHEFDLDGECACMGQMLFSPGEAMALEWSDGCLYMAVPGVNQEPVLYQIDNMSELYQNHFEADEWTSEEFLRFRSIDAWTLEEVYRFDTFAEINRLVFLGDRMYVQGVLTTEEQAIGYTDRNNLDAGVTLLSMDGIPQDMIKFDENTLGIYLAGEGETCFWKYIPAEEKWEKTDIAAVKYSETAEESVNNREFVAYENGCFYVKDDKIVCYQTVDGTERELFESDGSVKCLEADGAFLYYASDEWQTKEVRRIRISELL